MARWNWPYRRRGAEGSRAGQLRSVAVQYWSPEQASLPHTIPRGQRPVSGLPVPPDDRPVVPWLRTHPRHVRVAARTRRCSTELQRLHPAGARGDRGRLARVATSVVGHARPPTPLGHRPIRVRCPANPADRLRSPEKPPSQHFARPSRHSECCGHQRSPLSRIACAGARIVDRALLGGAQISTDRRESDVSRRRVQAGASCGRRAVLGGAARSRLLRS